MAFYKRDGEELLVGENFVSAPSFELLAEHHTEYDYPVDGWYWFDTQSEAEAMIETLPNIEFSDG